MNTRFISAADFPSESRAHSLSLVLIKMSPAAANGHLVRVKQHFQPFLSSILSNRRIRSHRGLRAGCARASKGQNLCRMHLGALRGG